VQKNIQINTEPSTFDLKKYKEGPWW